jgi:hypothetical protein
MNPMSEPTRKMLAKIADEALAEVADDDPVRIKHLGELLAFWLGHAEGATARAEAAEAKVAKLEAKVAPVDYLAPLGEVSPEESEALAHLLRALRPRVLFKSDDEHLGACLAVIVQGHVRVGRGEGMVVAMQVAAP